MFTYYPVKLVLCVFQLLYFKGTVLNLFGNNLFKICILKIDSSGLFKTTFFTLNNRQQLNFQLFESMHFRESSVKLSLLWC